MRKGVARKENVVLSIGLRPTLFTLAQMRATTFLQFFDLSSEDGAWKDVDLTRVEPLFCVHVASAFLKEHPIEKVPPHRVKPNCRPIPPRMLAYDFGKMGHADLVEMNDRYETLIMNGAELVQTGLTPKEDLDAIYNYEYSGMFGSKAIRDRLLRYFDTGVNFDDSKSKFFQGLKPPPSKGKKAPQAKPISTSRERPTPADRWRETRPTVARKVRPLLRQLGEELKVLPAKSSTDVKLKVFERCVRKINRHESKIETEEREAILGEIYELGASVGLDPTSEFAERWRGEW